MKQTLNECDIEPFGLADDLHVLVAYEDFSAGSRAMALLKRVGRDCEGLGRLIHTMWRFDVMSDPSFFNLAVSEALSADLVVIAAHEGEQLPQGVKNWIAHWLLTKEPDRPLALVASLEHKSGAANGQRRILTYLEKVAHHGKLQFFANGGEGTTGVVRGKVMLDASGRTETNAEEFSLQTF